jgi:hypothetical protein
MRKRFLCSSAARLSTLTDAVLIVAGCLFPTKNPHSQRSQDFSEISTLTLIYMILDLHNYCQLRWLLLNPPRMPNVLTPDFPDVNDYYGPGQVNEMQERLLELELTGT